MEQASLAESRGFPRGARHSYSDSPVQVVQERQAVVARIAPPFQYSILGTGAHPGSLPDRPTCPPSRCVLGRFVKTDKAIAKRAVQPEAATQMARRSSRIIRAARRRRRRRRRQRRQSPSATADRPRIHLDLIGADDSTEPQDGRRPRCSRVAPAEQRDVPANAVATCKTRKACSNAPPQG